MKRLLPVLAFLLAFGCMPVYDDAEARVCPRGFRLQAGKCIRIAPAPAPVPGPAVHGPDTKIVTAYTLNMRKCPGSKCRIINVLHRGTPVKILSKQGAYVRVVVPGSGIEGWVLLRHLSR